jgi:hypothetical protein
MLVIKSLLEPISEQMSDHVAPVYWDGKAWGKGLEWAATYTSLDDLPIKIGSSLLDRNSNPLCYRIQGKEAMGEAIALVEIIRTKEELPANLPCYYIHADLHIATQLEKIQILAMVNQALNAVICPAMEVLSLHVDVIPDNRARVKPRSLQASSITRTPLILEPRTMTDVIDQAKDPTLPKKPK